MGGYGTQEFIRLRIAPIGPTGRLLVEAAVAFNGIREKTYHKLETAFIAFPHELAIFRRGLLAFLSERVPSRAVLAGDVT